MFEMNNYRLFTVRYFSVRSSISRALPYGWPSWMSVKSTLGGGGGDGLGGGEKIFFCLLPLTTYIPPTPAPAVHVKPRWPPLPVSARSLRSYEKIRDS